ncbi:unnamed protein product [Fraxinus pennsylvanica]|uniref:Uncharacterized protein n=1 Tax=Fraxinus pennsylvanica TaxID=56036 RepID=A0AAD1YZ41_9LAMI|nr:unnamed protein product [Fraxinus pennsylvanica]
MSASEDFGCSGSVDTQSNFPEESDAPKKKSISLNVEGFDGSIVPIQAFSLSRMSHMQRRDLEMKLKNELEQVRKLQKKIALLSSNATIDMHCYGDGPKRPAKVKSCPISVNKLTAALPEMKNIPRGRNTPHMKGGAMAARQTELEKKHGLQQNTNYVRLMKQCDVLLNRLMKQKNAPIFNSPVDIIAYNIPDYFNVIKHPMDLGTVKTKLLSGRYSSPEGFAADVRLTLKNAMIYNPPGHYVHLAAEKMNKFFEVRWKQIEKKISVTMDESMLLTSSAIMEAKTPSKPPAKKLKITSAENKIKQESVKPVMSNVEMRKLAAELNLLLEELPDNIINFLKESSFNGRQVNEGEMTIELDTFSDNNLFKLRKLLDDYIEKKQKNQAKIWRCETEIRNESGYSNPNVQPRKGGEPAERDVDIARNDTATSSFPHVDIDKDAARRDCQFRSSSSSSSESGSSSTDSDSGNSSGSESDGVEDSVPVNSAKETVVSGVEKENDLGDLNTRDFLNGHATRNSPTKSASAEPNCCQEGESAPSERQVSPETLLDDYEGKKQKNLAKNWPYEIEMRNESGYSNSYVQPRQEIDKDAAQRDSQCRSSSSSSSDSGSSSTTDSDSENSSGSESDSVEDSVPASTAKENVVPLAEKENDLGDVNTIDFLNERTVRNSPSKSASVEPICHQEGKCAPPERQVSPEKSYRAALLRSRFADIIIKAKENTFGKGERQDPEKLKLDREERERWRREEKARIIEEAKAAEVGRIKAEAEAAAEARRKVELEREAARQALEKMEKTVDINDNSLFMEDLEMFRASPDVNSHGVIEETNLDYSQNGLGRFKFRSRSNPWEQLGLYMKMDEEEEDEVKPQTIPDAFHEPRGEID